MSGIAGVFGRSDAAAVCRMLDLQHARGPHRRWIRTAPGWVTLGCDTWDEGDETGRIGRLWLAVDGEWYDAPSRADLGAESVEGLLQHEGSFALAAWDPERGLLLARDRLGTKPLYYGYDEDGHLLFASEIKALVDRVEPIQSLPPGHLWWVGEEPRRYAGELTGAPEAVLPDPDEAVQRLDAALQAAVAQRLAVDGRVGIFLSGGLDSSLIAALVRRLWSGEIHTFAVGLEGSADLERAQAVADYLGTTHHQAVLDPDRVIAALPRVVDRLESCDAPLVRGAVATHFAAALAAEHSTVLLSGEGADELFAGYQYLSDLGPTELAAELRLITETLHQTGLQRVDRMAAAHGLQVRLPFLDSRVVRLAFQVPIALKRRDEWGKWLVRRVAQRYLPPDVAWRPKEKFAVGTGVGPLLERHAAETVDLQRVLSPAGEPFGTHEEALCWSLFRKRYGRSDIVASMGHSRSRNPGERWTSAL